MEPISWGAIFGLQAILAGIAGGIVGNRADAAFMEAWGTFMEAWGTGVKALSKQLKQEDSTRYVLEASIHQALLTAQQTIAYESLDRLTNGFQKWQGIYQCANIHRSDVSWLEKHLKSLKRNKNLDANFEPPAELGIIETPEIFIAPKDFFNETGIEKVKQTLLNYVTQDPKTPDLYRKIAEEKLYERICWAFENEISKSPVVQSILQNQLLSQINYAVSEHAISLKSVQDTLKRHASNLNEIKALLLQQSHNRVKETQNSQPIPQNLPYTSLGKNDFIGRDEDLEKLYQMLEIPDSRVFVAVSGMRGVGKSELVIQYGLKYKNIYPGGICWIQSKQKDIAEQIIDFAKAYLDLDPPTEISKSLTKIEWCWQHWPQKKTLLVFDDVFSEVDIRLYFPPQDSCFRVILTTYQKLLKTNERLDLYSLKIEDAIILIQSRISNKSRISTDLKSTEALCNWLGRLPLGLQLVSSYLERKSKLSPSELLRKLQNQQSDQSEQKALNKPHPSSGINYPLGVKDAFDLTWQELDPIAQEIASLICIFRNTPFPWRIVEECLKHRDPEDLEDSRDDYLIGFYLLERVGSETYQLHSLTRLFFQNKLVEQWGTENLLQAVTLRLKELAHKNPTNISKILDQKLIDWTIKAEESYFDSIDYGQQIWELTNEWIQWIAPLSRLTIPVRSDGNLPTLGVAVEYKYQNEPWGPIPYLKTGWYFPASLDKVVQLPKEISEKLVINDQVTDEDLIVSGTSEISSTGDWNYLKSEILNKNVSWVWKQCFSQISDSLKNILNKRAIPIGIEASETYSSLYDEAAPPIPQLFPPQRFPYSPNLVSSKLDEIKNPIATEGAWYSAVFLMDRYQSGAVNLNPISLDVLEEKLTQISNGMQLPSAMIDAIRLEQLKREVESLRRQGQQHFFYPWQKMLSQDSEDTLIHAHQVYQSAIQEYQKVISQWFPRLEAWLETAQKFPVCVKGVFVPQRTPQYGAGLSWYWDVLPYSSESFVEFSLSDRPIDGNDICIQTAFQKLQVLRKNKFKTMEICSGDQDMIDLTPVTNLVYKWLWSDLEKIGWVQGALSGYGLFKGRH